jgi:glutamine synthetase
VGLEVITPEDCRKFCRGKGVPTRFYADVEDVTFLAEVVELASKDGARGQLTGNGAHYHMSLEDAESGRNLFLDEKAEHGLSQLGRWFRGGVLQHADGFSAITAPLTNSYKRLIAGAPQSGATWAPVYITYGPANRTQMIRIPGPGRIEDRAIDGAANPYLACAAILAAGMHGVETK